MFMFNYYETDRNVRGETGRNWLALQLYDPLFITDCITNNTNNKEFLQWSDNAVIIYILSLACKYIDKKKSRPCFPNRNDKRCDNNEIPWKSMVMVRARWNVRLEIEIPMRNCGSIAYSWTQKHTSSLSAEFQMD